VATISMPICSATALAVHKNRKRLTQTRASLRLLRVCIGDDTCHWRDSILRDATRQSNAARDAEVLVQTAARLRRPSDSMRVERGIDDLLTVLTEERNATPARREVTQAHTAFLRAIGRRLTKMPPSSLTMSSSAAAGLVGTYKKCRRLFSVRSADPPTRICTNGANK
jgi:hypothetical protein